jgi:hypothetical protein
MLPAISLTFSGSTTKIVEQAAFAGNNSVAGLDFPPKADL